MEFLLQLGRRWRDVGLAVVELFRWARSRAVPSTALLLASSALALEATPPPRPVPAADAAGPVVDLRVAGRKPVGGLRTVRSVRGQTILLNVSADEKMTIHLHGYDLQRAVAPGVTTVVSFKAHAAGRFPVTAHLTGAVHHGPEPTLLYIDVHPD